ncbi:solute carrier family 22 member 4-like isoform X1 [Aricia agestis]|uniref:solute carrier family 22 member 4-like isoform X1 n=1 Tax=Aricia agestis TaxID=91739 RepID=UPI001C2033B0|nr:solute carrier family 22 member 4-like isoform X1 [Aricia agestis]
MPDINCVGREKVVDLDEVLVTELGQFGWYQTRNILLAGIAIISSAFFSEYVFTAAAVPHRCRIPECGETSKSDIFEPEWITNAIPLTGSGSLESCERFVGLGNGTLDYCPASLFGQAREECEEFVYGLDISVAYDFDLGCRDWVRALSGTVSSIGTLLVLPIIGYISDKFGRKIALVISVFNLALFGVIKAFSVNLTMYMIMQLVHTTLGAGIYSSAFILAAEMVGPKYRVLTSAIQSSLFASGQMLMGLIAWGIQPWRYLMLALYTPCFLMVSYYWLLSESVRWLLSKHKYEEARKVLENVAELNNTTISEKSIIALMTQIENSQPEEDKQSLVTRIIRSPILLRRVCTTPIWWITTIFVYYGLSINSTSLSETTYLNYIVTCGIEIPGFFTAVLILDKIGRKATLTSGFFLSAACNIGFIFIPAEITVARLIIFLLGKFGISVVMTSLYLYTSELYPTEFRHTLLAFSSMIGRIGSITAPLTPVLANYWHGTPSALFGGMAVVSGLLTLTQPETLGTRMPNTLEEAEAIGKPEMKIRNEA